MRAPGERLGPGNLSLKTRLLLMMLSLLVLSVSSLFLLHMYSERQLLSQVREYTEDLSTAIEIAQEQPAAMEGGDPKAALSAYAEKLRQLGVKDVSIADITDEVQASTNPQNVGKRLVRGTKKKGPDQYVVRGVLGDESGSEGVQKSTLTIPLVVGDQRVGNLVITRYLDDFSNLSREALVSRVIATLAVFSLGILVSLLLSWSFTRPLRQLTDAARSVAAGDLGVQVPPGGRNEIGSLSRTFNEMVERLREHRRLEERLHFAERATALGRLASAMAHEIRNPLNFISLSIDHVRGQFHPEEARRKEEFDRILINVKAEISRLNRLVGDFLSFGKPMRLYPRVIAIEELLGEVASLVEPKARDQGIAVELESEADVPMILADPELLKTCFLNLMINAMDAMPDGGLLSVALSKGEDGLKIEVKDNGQGMTEEAIRSAFEPYFSTKETGLGIGLALTHKIVTDHGGTIGLESAPGRGTIARIQLPLSAEGTALARDGAAVVAS